MHQPTSPQSTGMADYNQPVVPHKPQMVTPMNLQQLNKVCFTICIVCIVLGTVLSLAMIWAPFSDYEFVWKSWLTIGVFFLASALTLCVSKTLDWRTKHRHEE